MVIAKRIAFVLLASSAALLCQSKDLAAVSNKNVFWCSNTKKASRDPALVCERTRAECKLIRTDGTPWAHNDTWDCSAKATAWCFTWQSRFDQGTTHLNHDADFSCAPTLKDCVAWKNIDFFKPFDDPMGAHWSYDMSECFEYKN
jgi:hypothetical protein